MRSLKAALAASLLCSSIAALSPSAASAVAHPQRRVASTAAPYVVAILHNETAGIDDPQPVCTGSLIDERTVLTAAHCLIDVQPAQLSLAIGGTDLTTATRFGVMDFEIHPRYTIPTSQAEIGLPNDIAVIRTTEPVTIVKPIALAPRNDTPSRTGRKGMALYGWGIDQFGELNTQLGYVKQKDYSRTAHRWFPEFKRSVQIAAGLRLKSGVFAGACSGDSGGPLVGRWKQQPVVLGIVSYGAAICTEAAPTVFTRVSRYRSWINTATRTLADRQASSSLAYMLADPAADATGPAAANLDILLAGITTSNATTSFYVRLAALQHPAYDFTAWLFLPNSAEAVAWIDKSGVFRYADASQVCPEPLLEPATASFSMSISSACITALLGSHFDVLLQLDGFDSAQAPAPSASDTVTFESLRIASL